MKMPETSQALLNPMISEALSSSWRSVCFLLLIKLQIVILRCCRGEPKDIQQNTFCVVSSQFNMGIDGKLWNISEALAHFQIVVRCFAVYCEHMGVGF